MPPDRFNAQRGQDQWVLQAFRGVQPAHSHALFYLDLAAQEPACNSNTWALDHRGWKGICIDASPAYAAKLRHARSCTVIEAAVDSTIWNASYLAVGGYGGLIGEGFDNFGADPRRQAAGKANDKASVEPPQVLNVTTRRLVDILAEARAPRIVHYLSLDVEGGEGRVLTHDVLSTYTFLTMTVERPSPKLNELLFGHGYLFVKNLEFDGHYVHNSHPRALELERNATFEQLPAKCTPHSPKRINRLYANREYPTARCSNAGYFTIYSDVRPFTGACCYHRDVSCAQLPSKKSKILTSTGGAVPARPADCIHLNYGQPTSRHAIKDMLPTNATRPRRGSLA